MDNESVIIYKKLVGQLDFNKYGKCFNKKYLKG